MDILRGCTISGVPSSHLGAKDKADAQHKIQASIASTNAFWSEEFDHLFNEDVAEGSVLSQSSIQFGPDCFDIREAGAIVGSEFELTDRLFQDALSDSSSDCFVSDIDVLIPPNALPASAAETVTRASTLRVGAGSTSPIDLTLGAPIASPTVMRPYPSQAMRAAPFQKPPPPVMASTFDYLAAPMQQSYFSAPAEQQDQEVLIPIATPSVMVHYPSQPTKTAPSQKPPPPVMAASFDYFAAPMQACIHNAMPSPSSFTYQSIEQNHADPVVPIPRPTPPLPSLNAIQHYPVQCSLYATTAHMPPSNPGPTGRVDAHIQANPGVHHRADTHLLALPQGYLLQNRNNTYTHTFEGYTSSQDTSNSVGHHHPHPSTSVPSAHNLPATMSGVTADARVRDVQPVNTNPEPLNRASSIDNDRYLPPTRREPYFVERGVYCFTKFTCTWDTCDKKISLDTHDSDAAYQQSVYGHILVHAKEGLASTTRECKKQNCRIFTSKDYKTFKRHVLSVLGPIVYFCDECDNQWTRPEARKNHKKNNRCTKTVVGIHSDVATTFGSSSTSLCSTSTLSPAPSVASKDDTYETRPMKRRRTH
ncbi:hypothetical protein H0H87_007803 [Tephrocybe sp. NHM501043]|nr:hypothetical protein H0H87_007803 [Tephrocybe sp. NHM501043]